MMNARLGLLALLLLSCSETTNLVVVVPKLSLGGRELKLGEQIEGRTARFYETRGVLFLPDGSVAPAGFARAPLQWTTMFVVAPFALTHEDIAAADPGKKRLRVGSSVTVAKDAGAAGTLILLDGQKPVAFVRASDVRQTQPTADELMTAAREAVLAGDLSDAGEFAQAALVREPGHLSALRLRAALLHDASAASGGWALWTKVKPAEPPSDHVKNASVAFGPGPAFAVADQISLREKPEPSAKRVRFLPIGCRVTVASSAGEWAEVTVVSDRSGVRLGVVPVVALVDGVKPWEVSEASGGVAPLRGFVMAKFLSSTAPDSVALKKIGFEKIEAGAAAEAIVPLRRALALSAEQAVRDALVKAAVQTDQFIIALEARRVLVHPAGAEPPPWTLEIVRVRGCRGKRERARDRIDDSLFSPPTFSETGGGAKGSADASSLGRDVCILDDEPERACRPSDSFQTIQAYFGTEFDETGGIDTPPFTKEQEREYAGYAREQAKAVAKLGKLYASYEDDYARWQRKIDNGFAGTAIVVRLRSRVARASGLIGIYRFTWDVYSTCGDVTATRKNLELLSVVTPQMAAGDLLELWIEGADLEPVWGAVLIDELKASDGEAEATDPKGRFLEILGAPVTSDEWREVVEVYRDRAAENGKGISSCDIVDECGC